jgi:hypothetical protein
MHGKRSAALAPEANLSRGRTEAVPDCCAVDIAGRAQKPGGEGKPRYFIDTSYCQPYDGDRKWPGGDNGHTIGQRLGLQAGKYDHVWDPTKCYAKKN